MADERGIDAGVDVDVDVDVGGNESPFAYVKVMEGTDKQGYYTLVYRNGEPGPRSEGYQAGIDAAIRAANRDFPDLTIYVDKGQHPPDLPPAAE